MMRRILFLIAAILGCVSLAQGNENAQGWCESGATVVVTSGLSSNNLVQGSFPACTISVYVHGGGLATIYSDNNNTALANPFSAQTNGQWNFYGTGRVDITMTGGGLPGPVTYSDVILYDPAQDSTTQCVLASSTTPAFNAQICSIFSMTLTASAAASISGGIPGQSIMVSLKQGSGGPYAFTWPSTFLNPPTLTSVAGASAQFRFTLLADGLWHHAGTGESQVFNTAQNGNQLFVNNNPITGTTGTGGTVVEQNTPNIVSPAITGTATAGNLNHTLTVDGVQYTTIAAAEAACVTLTSCRIVVPTGTNPTLSSVLVLSVPTDLYLMPNNTLTCAMTDPGPTTGCINVTSNKVTIECADHSALITQPNGQNIETAIFLGANADETIKNCAFNWNDENQTATGGDYTTIRSAGGSSDIRVTDNYFTEGGDRTIDLRGVNRAWVQRNHFYKSGINVAGVTNRGGNSVSVDVDGTTVSTDAFCTYNMDDWHGDSFACTGQRIHITGNTIRGAADFGQTPLDTEAGIDASRSVNMEVIGNHLINARGPQLTVQSILVDGVNYVSRDVRVEGNTFTATATCCGLGATDPRVIASIAGGGITSGQQLNFGFINNTFDGTRLAIDTVKNLQVIGNGFHNISSTLVGGTALIIDQISNGYGAVMADFTISGNTFTTDNATLLSAIDLTSAVTTPDSCVLTDNSISTSVATGITATAGFPATTCYVSMSNLTIGSFSNTPSIINSIQLNSLALPGTLSTVGGLTDTSLLTSLKRIHFHGTAVTASNFSISSGWGTGASCPSSCVVNDNPVDSDGLITITSGSGAITANPTVTLTFADGTGTNAVICPATRADAVSDTIRVSQTGFSTTSATWTFVGTPGTSTNYVFTWHCNFH